MRSVDASIFQSGSIVASLNKDYCSMCPFNEFAKQRYLLITSTGDSYISRLKDIRLVYLHRHEQVLCISRD